MVETIIKWKTPLFKADADKCYQEIKSIGDEVTPEQVVNAAKDPTAELHKCFDWDDKVAADKYRLVQARTVLNQLIVVTHNTSDEVKEPTQFRVMMKNDTVKGSGYKQTICMVRDENEYQKLLEQARRELKAFKQKYSCLTELAEIIALID